ncbi:hypothetical protein ACQ7HM_03445 [Williamsia sp. MIQD14]|uniref:hypothetical protein n=1 Tax=Williamsia sp. MIQD14 TaxID=3425703 RepID=UPI003DA1A098
MKQNTRTPSEGNEPTVDLLGHLRGLLKVAPIAIVIAIVVALGVFGYQSVAAQRYQASVVAQIVTPGSAATGQSGPTSTDAATAAGPFVALASDHQVLAQIAKTSGLGLDSSQLSADIVVAASTVPGIVDVTAEADSAQDAETLAKAVVSTLDATYVQRQQSAASAPATNGMGTGLQSLTTQLESLTAQLDGVITADGPAAGILTALKSQIDQLKAQQQTAASATQPITAATQRLILLSQPAGGPKAASIPPIAIAGVAGLLALILSAELLVFARSFLGRSVNREWSRRIGRRAHAVVDIPRRGEEISTSTLAAVARVSGPVLIVASEQVRGVVARIVAHVHGRVDGRDIDDDNWTPDERDHSLAVVVVRDGQVERARVSKALETLAAWNIPAILVVAPSGRGSFSLPGGLAVAFRKPSEAGAPSRASSAPAPTSGSAPAVTAPAPVSAPVTPPPPITPNDPAAGYLPYRPLAAEGANGMSAVPTRTTNGVQSTGATVQSGAAQQVPVQQQGSVVAEDDPVDETAVVHDDTAVADQDPDGNAPSEQSVEAEEDAVAAPESDSSSESDAAETGTAATEDADITPDDAEAEGVDESERTPQTTHS